MSLIGTFHDFRHMLMAHMVEVQLTAQNFNIFRDAYVSIDSSRSLPFSSFVRAVGLLLKNVPEDVRATLYSEASFRTWFASLDEDFDNLVEWTEIVNALSVVAAMRRCPTVLSRALVTHRWHDDRVERAIWVDVWRRIVVCSSTSHEVHTYSSNGTFLSSFKGHLSTVLCATYLRPIARLCTAACDRQVVIWDPKHFGVQNSTLVESPASCIAFDSDRQLIWVALLNGTLCGLDVTLSCMVAVSQHKHDDWIRELIFVPELRMLVSASLDRTVGLWTNDGELVCRKVGHTRSVGCIAFAPIVRLLFTGGQGKEIMIWNPYSPASGPVHTLHGHEKDICGIFADQINTSVVSIDIGVRVIVWDAVRYVALQVVEGGERFIQHAPLRACCQNPVTRELFLFSDHFTRVPSIISALRPPKLGHRLIGLHYSLPLRLLFASTASSVHVFDALSGEVQKSVDRPFGVDQRIQSTSLVEDTLFIASDDKRMLSLAIAGLTTVHTKDKMRMRHVLMEFPSSVFRVFSTKHGVGVCFSNGTLCLYSSRESDQELLLAELVRVTFSGAILRCACCPALDHVAVTFENAEKKREVGVWSVVKGVISVLPLEPASVPVDLCFVETRNTLVVANQTSLDIFNVGSFVRLAHVADCATGMDGPESALTRIVPMTGDAVLCSTQAHGNLVSIDLQNAFGKFFASQSEGIVESAAGATDNMLVQASYYAVSRDAPVETLTAYLYHGIDRRTSEPVLLKQHKSVKDHIREVSVRSAMEDQATFIVRFLHTWDSNAALSPGTVPQGIIMERGDATLREVTDSVSYLTKGEVTHMVLCLLHIVQAVHDHGYVISDLKPRNIVRVGDAWKLCGLDSLVKKNDRCPSRSSPIYCPPEWCPKCLHQTLDDIPADPASNMWTLGVMVYELQSKKHLFDGTSSVEILRNIQNASEEIFRLHKSDVADNDVAAFVFSQCLRKDPAARATAKEVLDGLAVRGYQLDPSTIFARALCFANQECHSLPTNVSSRVVQVTVSATATVLTLKQIALTRELVFDPSSSLVMVADENPHNNGEGAVHLLDAEGSSYGFLPRSELGEDESTRWRWPCDDDRMSERNLIVNLETGKSSVEVAPGDHHVSFRNMPLRGDLAPPKGWQSMDSSQLHSVLAEEKQGKTAAIRRTLKSRTHHSGKDSELDAVDCLKNNVLALSPFFRGGCIDGDPIPLYATAPTRRKPMTLAQARIAAEESEERYKRCRGKRLWDRMRTELQLEEPNAPQKRPNDKLDSRFLRTLPELRSAEKEDAHEGELERRGSEWNMSTNVASFPKLSDEVERMVRVERAREVDTDLCCVQPRIRQNYLEALRSPRFERDIVRQLSSSPVRTSLPPSPTPSVKAGHVPRATRTVEQKNVSTL